jgi:FkbM family methyltransferase
MKDYEEKTFERVFEYLDTLIEENHTLTGTVVDGGAHTGLWSLRLSEYYWSHNVAPRIVAFEPDKDNFRCLQKNADQPQTGIQCIEGALWNRTGVPLYLTSHESPSRHAVTMNPDLGLPCKSYALDSMVKDDKRELDVIKLDVEGAELMALNGMKDVLRANKELLLVVEFNLNTMRVAGHTCEQLLGFLRVMGFDFYSGYDVRQIDNLKNDSVHNALFVKGDTI